jgi:hypothetical protein
MHERYNTMTEQQADYAVPPCILEGLPFEDYLQWPAAGSHALHDLLHKSPAHAKTQRPQSPGMSLGTLCHSLIGTPEMPIYIRPAECGKTSNAAKAALVAWLAELLGVDHPEPTSGKLPEGKILDHQLGVLEPMLDARRDLVIATPEQMETAQRVRDAVMAHPLSGSIYADGRPEVTMLARDPVSGVLCKIRLDWLPEGHDVLVDLKTAAEVWPDAVARSASRYAYHWQAAYYRRIYALVTGKPRPPWINIYAETQAPWSVLIQQMPDEPMARVDPAIDHALRVWGLCEQHRVWPGPGWDWTTMSYTVGQAEIKPWA